MRIGRVRALGGGSAGGWVVCAAGWLALGAGAGAEVINLPPVVVQSLVRTRTYESAPVNATFFSDAVYLDSGQGRLSASTFAAAIGAGDTVVFRLEAPAGQQFSLTPVVGGANSVSFSFEWLTGVGDSLSATAAATTTLENLVGPAPTETYALQGMGAAGNSLVVQRQYSFGAACTFTAIRIQFAVNAGVPDQMRYYRQFDSTSSGALGATARVAGNATNDPPPIVALTAAPAPGACCRGTGCSLVLATGCVGGAFLGSGSTCSPVVRGGSSNPCCPADFNASGAVSVQDIFDFLAAYFGGCP